MAYGDYATGLIDRATSLGLPPYLRKKLRPYLTGEAIAAEAAANVESTYRSGLLSIENQRIAMQKEAYERAVELEKQKGKPSIQDIMGIGLMGKELGLGGVAKGLAIEAGLMKGTGATGLIGAGGTGVTGAAGATSAVTGLAATSSGIPEVLYATPQMTAIPPTSGGLLSSAGGVLSKVAPPLAAIGVGQFLGKTELGSKLTPWGGKKTEAKIGGTLGGAAAGAMVFGPLGAVIGGALGFISESTVICTELYKQGHLSQELYELDKEFGKTVEPDIYQGYRQLADPIVRLMQKSPFITKWIVRPIAMQWAEEMAHRIKPEKYKSNKIGRIIMEFGIPICRWLGKKKEVAYGLT